MLVEDILSIASKKADENNGIVIFNAIRESLLKPCPNCIFYKNFEDYLKNLSAYIFHKIKLHRLRRASDHYYDMSIIHNPRGGNSILCSKVEEEIIYHTAKIKTIKEEMRRIEPCESCKKRYNPHHSSKWCYREFNKPDKKDISDVDILASIV